MSFGGAVDSATLYITGDFREVEAELNALAMKLEDIDKLTKQLGGGLTTGLQTAFSGLAGGKEAAGASKASAAMAKQAELAGNAAAEAAPKIRALLDVFTGQLAGIKEVTGELKKLGSAAELRAITREFAKADPDRMEAFADRLLDIGAAAEQSVDALNRMGAAMAMVSQSASGFGRALPAGVTGGVIDSGTIVIDGDVSGAINELGILGKRLEEMEQTAMQLAAATSDAVGVGVDKYKEQAAAAVSARKATQNLVDLLERAARGELTKEGLEKGMRDFRAETNRATNALGGMATRVGPLWENRMRNILGNVGHHLSRVRVGIGLVQFALASLGGGAAATAIVQLADRFAIVDDDARLFRQELNNAKDSVVILVKQSGILNAAWKEISGHLSDLNRAAAVDPKAMEALEAAGLARKLELQMRGAELELANAESRKFAPEKLAAMRANIQMLRAEMDAMTVRAGEIIKRQAEGPDDSAAAMMAAIKHLEAWTAIRGQAEALAGVEQAQRKNNELAKLHAQIQQQAKDASESGLVIHQKQLAITRAELAVKDAGLAADQKRQAAQMKFMNDLIDAAQKANESEEATKSLLGNLRDQSGDISRHIAGVVQDGKASAKELQAIADAYGKSTGMLAETFRGRMAQIDNERKAAVAAATAERTSQESELRRAADDAERAFRKIADGATLFVEPMKRAFEAAGHQVGEIEQKSKNAFGGITAGAQEAINAVDALAKLTGRLDERSLAAQRGMFTAGRDPVVQQRAKQLQERVELERMAYEIGLREREEYQVAMEAMALRHTNEMADLARSIAVENQTLMRANTGGIFGDLSTIRSQSDATIALIRDIGAQWDSALKDSIVAPFQLMGAAIEDTFRTLGSGEGFKGMQLLRVLGKMVGDIMVQMGNSLLTYGATLIAMEAANISPVAWGITGGPGAPTTAGAIMLGAGAALIAGGAAIGGAAGGKKGKKPASPVGYRGPRAQSSEGDRIVSRERVVVFGNELFTRDEVAARYVETQRLAKRNGFYNPMEAT